jgi:hypothetical protein
MQRHLDEAASRSREAEEQQMVMAAEAARLREQVSGRAPCVVCCLALCCVMLSNVAPWPEPPGAAARRGAVDWAAAGLHGAAAARG